MKIKVFIMLIFAGVVFGITRDLPTAKLETVSSGLTAVNVYSMDALCDSINAVQTRHRAKAATTHEKADATTTAPTVYNVVATADAVNYLNGLRTALISHYAKDSCHVNGADATTTVPAAIGTSATIETIKTYAAALNTSQASHLARAHSTRYAWLLKEVIADFIAHCANDTIDGGTVHYKPDTSFNTVTMDSTGGGDPAAVDDSLFSAANVLKRHYNGHVGLFAANGSKSHQGHVAADSVTVANATNYTTLVALVNSIKAKYNTHLARTSAVWVTSIHKAADATNTSTVAAVSTASGHITTDTSTFTGAGHHFYAIPQGVKKLTVQYTGSSVSSGASFRTYGSLDPELYGWVYIDSTETLTANGFKHYNTNLYPFMKFYMSARADGTWNIGIQAEKENP